MPTTTTRSRSEAARPLPRPPLHPRNRDNIPKPGRLPGTHLLEVATRTQKKPGGGYRVSELESRLGNAEMELRKLKEQLVSETNKHATPPSADYEENSSNNTAEKEIEESEVSSILEDDNRCSVANDAKDNVDGRSTTEDAKDNAQENEGSSEAKKDINVEEMLELETKLWKTLKELSACQAENAGMKARLEVAEAEASAWRAREEELVGRVAVLEGEIGESRQREAELEVRLEAEAKAKAESEAEMGKLTVLMEQWRKAANVAAAIVCAENEGQLEAEGRRKSSVGKKMLGELWKKKHHH